MSELHEKINERMDKLQEHMENNEHLKQPEQTMLLILSISKFWSVLSEEDRDCIQGAQHAVYSQQQWEI